MIGHTDANTGPDYFNYKGFFSIIILAAMSSDNRFVWIDVSGKGSSSDAKICDGSKFNEGVQTNDRRASRSRIR
ncbi:hypothetical protein DPMN_083532 [Dreissena polymorpha]|uniref:DDE Tnp4 domain-containing protein n=1 Tax=Dreissena polymorpha TaxID=45954 RepID=A0A9D4BIJ6_DREPO|nr:hypothetical protein DPMN_083532 [Dreissena polymorpha]